MAAKLISVSWSTTGSTSSGGTTYVNSTDKIVVTYTFDSVAPMNAGNKIYLSNGAAAVLSSPGNTSVVTFSYTVPAGVNASNVRLLDTSIYYGNATGPGNTALKVTTFDLSAVPSSSPSQPLVIDTLAPTVTDASATDGNVHLGQVATFTLQVSEGAAITGTPTLSLSNGATASYDAGESTATSLVFKYTVGVGDTPSNDVTVLAVNGVTDAAGNPLVYAGNPTGDTHIFCFYPGTLIRTPEGEVAVEFLRIGDRVLTFEGSSAPVRWIGRQTVAADFADPLLALPVRIAAGALGENRPVRDLLVSPDHALLVDGIMIQAGALVNGASIRREHAVPRSFTYYHVELEDHSLLVAEGTPAETFVDNVTRRRFDNYAEYELLFGESVSHIAELEVPRIKSARQLPRAVRQRLDARAEALGFRIAAAA